MCRAAQHEHYLPTGWAEPAAGSVGVLRSLLLLWPEGWDNNGGIYFQSKWEKIFLEKLPHTHFKGQQSTTTMAWGFLCNAKVILQFLFLNVLLTLILSSLFKTNFHINLYQWTHLCVSPYFNFLAHLRTSVGFLIRSRQLQQQILTVAQSQLESSSA